MTASVTVLGPQRLQPIVRDVLDADGIEGSLAVITGGWEEREAELDVLGTHVARPTVNLCTARRREEALKADTPLREALIDRDERLRVAQALYRRRLRPALAVVRQLDGLELVRPDLLPPARADALRQVAEIDLHYQRQITGIQAAFDDVWRPVARPAVAVLRAQIAEQIATCSAVLIAGGHVGALLDQLRFFELGELLADRPLIGWAAGGMALCERVVLFHDSPPQGQSDPEVYDSGLGLAPWLVALPHATARLRLEDRTRVKLLAERFAPAMCVALDAGCGVRWDGSDWSPWGPVRRLTSDGEVAQLETPAAGLGAGHGAGASA